MFVLLLTWAVNIERLKHRFPEKNEIMHIKETFRSAFIKIYKSDRFIFLLIIIFFKKNRNNAPFNFEAILIPSSFFLGSLLQKFPSAPQGVGEGILFWTTIFRLLPFFATLPLT